LTGFPFFVAAMFGHDDRQHQAHPDTENSRALAQLGYSALGLSNVAFWWPYGLGSILGTDTPTKPNTRLSVDFGDFRHCERDRETERDRIIDRRSRIGLALYRDTHRHAFVDDRRFVAAPAA
jgi:hypothetical protein